MLASQSAVSSYSSSSIAGQSSLSLEASHDSKKRATNLWLPLSPFPTYSWDVQADLEKVQESDESSTGLSRVPALSWDSQPNSNDIVEDLPKSIFEDWEDSLSPNSRNVVEEDGVQTVIITPQSAFFHPPTPPAPFGYEPFSHAFPDNDMVMTRQQSIDELDSSGRIPVTPVALERPAAARPTKGVLFVDTNPYSPFGHRNSFALSASLFYSPKPADEVPSWAPKGFMYGPDVPLDCIYSAGDVSPVERWDEKLWSPVFLNSLRTAPCG